MLIIRSFHPEEVTALEKIVRNNPDSATQACAAMELVLAYFDRSSPFVRPTNIGELKSLQAALRAHLELVSEKISRREPGWNDGFLAQLASTKLEWLEKFGIGGEPPVLSGETVSGESVSTGKFAGKLCLVHFWNSHDLAGFRDIKALAQQHSMNVQLIGIVNGSKELAAAGMRYHGISWPVLWDQHQAGCIATIQ